jgi:hypothetical protein
MEPIRLATAEEIKAIEATSDLSSALSVVALGEGDRTVCAVIRQALEVDPMVAGNAVNTQRKALFIWGIENALRLQGFKQYYFNVLDSDATYKQIVQSWGAVPVSTAPEIRFKKVL